MQGGAPERGPPSPPVCLQTCHWRRKGAQELSSVRLRSHVTRAWEVQVKRPLSGNGGWWPPESPGFTGVWTCMSEKIFLTVRLQARLSARLRQKLMHEKGPFCLPPSFLWGSEAWRSRSSLYRWVAWSTLGEFCGWCRQEWRGYGNLSGSQRLCLLLGCVKDKGSSQERRVCGRR